MKRIRDGPGKDKVAFGAAFFVGKKADVQTGELRTEVVSGEKDKVATIRDRLCLMTVGTRERMSEEDKAVLRAQIDEILQAPLLIWKNGVFYSNWANCLGNKANSDDSSGDTKVSPFLVEETE